jgi:hypothetical protein
MEGHLRTSRYVGFLVIALGIILIVGAAVLPVSPASERLGPFRVDIRGDNCGPAAYVATKDDASQVCKTAAHRRLLSTTGIGLLVVALGMALFAGPEQRRGSMIEVPTQRVSRRRPVLRSPGSRRYKPG